MSELRANYTTISFLFSGLDRSRWFVSVERFSCDFSTVLGYVAGIGCLGLEEAWGSFLGNSVLRKERGILEWEFPTISEFVSFVIRSFANITSVSLLHVIIIWNNS